MEKQREIRGIEDPRRKQRGISDSSKENSPCANPAEKSEAARPEFRKKQYFHSFKKPFSETRLPIK